MEMWAMAGTGVGLMVIVIGMFVRIEHRMTKVETTMSIIAGRVGLCQPSLDENTK